MSTHDRQSEAAKPPDVGGDSRELTFVELTGKDRGRWSIYRNRFFQRISKAVTESMRRLMKAKGPRGRTVFEETQLFFGLGLSSLQAYLERPVLENVKRRVEIEREVQALRSAVTAYVSAQDDAVGEARSRKVAYDVILKLLAAGKIIPVKDGDSLNLLIHDLSAGDMKAFAEAKGYRFEQTSVSETPKGQGSQ